MGNVCGAPAAMDVTDDAHQTPAQHGHGHGHEHEHEHEHAHSQQAQAIQQPRVQSARRDRARDWQTTLTQWGKTHPPMTRSELMQRREEFWGTRVEGRPEMWQAIRLSAESGDDSTARVILESAGLTPYDIDRADACYCYDLKGFRYDIPLFILYEPRTLISDEKAATIQAATTTTHLSPEDAKRMDKLITFRGRFSDSRVPDLQLSFVGRTPLSQVKEWVQQQTGIPVTTQHLFYQGRKLQDHDNLVTSQIRTNMIIQFMIRPERDAEGNPIPIQIKSNITSAIPATSTQATNNIKISSGHSQSRSSISSSTSSLSSSSRSSRRDSRSPSPSPRQTTVDAVAATPITHTHQSSDPVAVK